MYSNKVIFNFIPRVLIRSIFVVEYLYVMNIIKIINYIMNYLLENIIFIYYTYMLFMIFNFLILY